MNFPNINKIWQLSFPLDWSFKDYLANFQASRAQILKKSIEQIDAKIDFSAKKFVYYNEELVTNSKFQTRLSRKL